MWYKKNTHKHSDGSDTKNAKLNVRIQKIDFIMERNEIESQKRINKCKDQYGCGEIVLLYQESTPNEL